MKTCLWSGTGESIRYVQWHTGAHIQVTALQRRQGALVSKETSLKAPHPVQMPARRNKVPQFKVSTGIASHGPDCVRPLACPLLPQQTCSWQPGQTCITTVTILSLWGLQMLIHYVYHLPPLIPRFSQQRGFPRNTVHRTVKREICNSYDPL